MKCFVRYVFAVSVFILFSEFSLNFLGYKTLSAKLSEYEKYVSIRNDSVYLVPFYYSDSLGIMKPRLTYKSNYIVPIYYRKYIELQEYLKSCSYNKDGFRGNSFDSLPVNKKKIMFIGDSYVFGYDAFPISNSFVDVVQRKDTNLYCLNFGVGGADVATYELIVRKYIKRIKPDLIVCCLYLDNDFVYYDKKIYPYEFNDVFVTNCGTLNKCNNNYSRDSIQIFDTYIDAYNNIRNHVYYKKNSNQIEYFLQKYSRTYAVIANSLLLKDYVVKSRVVEKKNHTMYYINSITNECEKNKTQLIFTIIPIFGCPDYDLNKKIIIDNLSDRMKLYFPLGLNKKHYDYDQRHTSHFNNEGYKFYGEFLYGLIDSVLNNNIKE